MRLHIVSDLHLELGVMWTPPKVDADVVILAGDIHENTHGIDWAGQVFVRERGLPVIYVAGNHEFYGSELHEMRRAMRLAAANAGVFFLDEDEVVIDGVRFIGATLWTDFQLFGAEASAEALRAARDGMPDFSVIRVAPTADLRPEGTPTSAFRPEDSMRLHDKSLGWIRFRLDEPIAGKRVVVTHHAPSFASIGQRFQHDLISAACASDLTLLAGRADLWVHGHTHTFADYQIDDCRVVCNPRGYLRPESYERSGPPDITGFRQDFVVEV